MLSTPPWWPQCAARPDRETIIARFAERIEHDRATELEEALQQIARIARFRLEAM